MKRLEKMKLNQKFELKDDELKQIVGGVTSSDGGIVPRDGCLACYTCLGCTSSCTICVGNYV